MQFEFATAARIVFGAGSSQELGALAKGFGRRALVVTGRDPRRSQAILDSLQAQQLQVQSFPISGEPDLAAVQEGVERGKSHSSEMVVALGGGSALDAGKAIAAMLTNDGDLIDFLEVIGRGKALTNPSLPVIAVPTTAGTGSEVTRNAVLASPEHRVKVSLRSPYLLARVAVIDPELTLELPPALTASTGLDALTQVIEPYVCSRPSPVTDALCEEGMKRGARSLPVAFKQGHDLPAREDMAVTALFGGFALTNAGLGAVHGFAGPIGGMFPASHGAICAALLPHVTETNLRALRQREPASEALHRYDKVARLLTGHPSAAADDAVAWLRHLVGELRIPKLGTYGVNPGHFDELADKAGKASSMKANPIRLTREELVEILEKAL
jgi:alcohol dehydrogenase class IV